MLPGYLMPKPVSASVPTPGHTAEQAGHIRDLHPDPENARKHTARNIGMIASAMQEVGAARSIVIDEDNNILAGHGAVEAAAQVGIERMRVVEADGEEIIAVRRRGLSKRAKKRLALLDNRSQELSSWDKDVLQGIYDDDPSILADLWREPELAELLGQIGQNAYQVIPMAFLPSEVEEIEKAWDDLALVYGDVDRFWIARFRDYDRIINGLTDPQQRRNLKYVNLHTWNTYRLDLPSTWRVSDCPAIT